MTHTTEIDEILRLPEVLRALGVARTTLYDGIAAGRFPRPVKITKHATGWLKSEIVAAQREMRKARDAQIKNGAAA